MSLARSLGKAQSQAASASRAGGLGLLLALCLALLGPANAAAVAPIITKVHVSDVTTTSVVLNATIDPQGKGTKYRFDYGPQDCEVGSCTPVPPGELTLPAASPPTKVSVPVAGLDPATTYHYRAVAKNLDGETKGTDHAFTTFAITSPFPPCPNDVFRIDRPSKHLPECRAYEQATPIFKNGLDATGAYLTVKSSPNGEAVTFVTASGTPESTGTQEPPLHLALRGAGNWLTQGLLPPQSFGQRAGVIGWTPDFSHVLLEVTRFTTPETKAMLDLRPDGSITEVVPYTTGSPSLNYAGSSADNSKLFIEVFGPALTPEATPGENNLYVWEPATEELGLVGVLPDADCSPAPCAPPNGSLAGRGGGIGSDYTQAQRAISTSGDSAYFTAGGTGQLYRHLDPTEPGATTEHVSASEKTDGGGEGGRDVNGARPAAFMGASADGSVAYFTSSEKLTNDANTGPEPDEAPSIARAKLTDGGEKTMDFLPTDAYGMTIEGEFIYWADPDADVIGRAKLNGSNPVSDVDKEFIEDAGEDPQYVAADAEHLYWTNAPPEAVAGERKGSVSRAKLNGSGDATDVELGFITDASNPKGIAVDDNFIYWANNCPGEKGVPSCPQPIRNELRTIARADLEGTPASIEEDFLEVGGGGAERDPQGIAVNATHVFMAMNVTQQFGLVLRYKLDGTDEETPKIFIDAQNVGIPGLRGLAIDSTFVYWAREGRNSIGRIPLDLEDDADALREWIPDAHGPKGLAIDAQHVYWSANQEVVPNLGVDLYRYTEVPTAGKHLSDIAVDTVSVNGVEARGVLCVSADGSYVYYVGNGEPDGLLNSPNGEGESAEPGDCNTVLQTTGSGTCNLYVWHDGQTQFIARLEEEDNPNWAQTTTIGGAELLKPARLSADGQTLLFSSHRQLTAYDNEGEEELYRYEFGDVAPTCISCDPTGTPPVDVRARHVQNPLLPNETLPASTLSRNLSEDGKRIFFETTDALVAEDVNGIGGCPIVGSEFQLYPACQDIYMWEAKGSGSCKSEAQNGGCLYLISTGKSSEPSLFADASADGEDVLFFTREPLVRQDGDKLFEVYDARVGGGLAAQEAVKDPCVSKEVCEGPLPEPPPPPQFLDKGSVPPESHKPRPKPCPKGKRRVKGKGAKAKSRCVAKKRAHKKGKAGKGKRRAHKSGGASR